MYLSWIQTIFLHANVDPHQIIANVYYSAFLAVFFASSFEQQEVLCTGHVFFLQLCHLFDYKKTICLHQGFKTFVLSHLLSLRATQKPYVTYSDLNSNSIDLASLWVSFSPSHAGSNITFYFP